MSEELILTDQEVKIFKRAGLIYGAVCLLLLLAVVLGWNSYARQSAELTQQETQYALQQQEAARLQRFINSTRSDSNQDSESFNAVTGN